MTVKSSGSLSFKSDIVAEFADAAPHSLSEFYGVDAPVPNSGEISFSDFYGVSDIITLSLTSDQNFLHLNLYDYAVSNGWNGSSKVELIIPNTVWVWSDDITKPGLLIEGFTSEVFVQNYGKIIGRGGNGASGSGDILANGENGGDAITITSSNDVYITNNSGAFIAGGGGGGGRGLYGGGGGGAGGGFGGPNEYYRGSDSWTSGGSINRSGSNGKYFSNGTPGKGGGAGGGSGRGVDNKGDDGAGSGGGGGRILPGVGGGGARSGGSANQVGQNGGGSRRGGGGGGWGAAGGYGDSTSRRGGLGGYSVRNSGNGNLFVSGDGTFYGVVG